MKLVTWNVNSLKARLGRVLELLEAHRPDVLCLQETKCRPDAFPHAELAAAGYEAVEHSAGQWAGVAIAFPAGSAPSEVVRGLPEEPDVTEARFIQARVGDLTVASVYVPNGREVGTPAYDAKLRFLDALAAHAPRLDALLGDMNVCRTDADVYDPVAFANATHVQPAERERLEAIIAAGPLLDAARELHPPHEPQYTWWDYRQGHFHRGLGLRIDYALLRPGLAGTLEHCAIDRPFRKGQKPSDHAPLVTVLG